MTSNDIYLCNKYTKWYFSIISTAQAKKRTVTKYQHKHGDYFETHHIIPKSLGGNNTRENLVILTSKEHLIVHMLLPKMCKHTPHKQKMISALWRLTNPQSTLQKTNRKITSKVYELARRLNQERMSSKFKNKSYVELYGEAKANELKAMRALKRKPRPDLSTRNSDPEFIEKQKEGRRLKKLLNAISSN